MKSSPADLLPEDIWADIFLSCLPVVKSKAFRESHDHSVALAAHRIILDLTRVCRFWRGAILSRPHFWCNIVVLLDTVSTSKDAAGEEQLRTHLQRSQKLPLRIWVSSISDRPHLPLMDICIAAASRWQSLHATLPLPALDDVIQKLNTNLSCLEIMSLRQATRGRVANASPFLPCRTLGPAPSLTELTLEGLPFLVSPMLYLSLPWNQLTRLTVLRSGRVVHLIPLLSAAPDLEELYLGGCTFAPPKTVVPVLMGKLKALWVEGHLIELGAHIINLETPSLRFLSIEAYCPPYPYLPAINSLISRSGSRLETLRLAADGYPVLFPFDERSYPEHARLAASASELQLVGIIRDKVLSDLAYRPGQNPPSFAPRLKRLVLDGSLEMDGFGYKLLADLLESRSGSKISDQPTPNNPNSFTVRFVRREGRRLDGVSRDLANRFHPFLTSGVFAYNDGD